MRQTQLIEKAVGPAPWFWETFPEPTGASGKRYIWMYHGEQGPIGYLVTLNPRQSPDTTVLALNRGCRPFPLAGGMLGLWCEEQPFQRGQKPYIRVMCFETDALTPFALDAVAGWFKQSNDPVYSLTAPLAEFELPSDLAAGTHPVEVPTEFRGIDELLMVTNISAQVRGLQASAVIYVLRPAAGTVEVLPQRWFTADKYDLDHQWIARVARDPMTGRLVGGGLRIGNFELTDDGCDLAQWIE